MLQKQCNTCSKTKPISEYHKNKRQRYGYSNTCKPCRKTLQADKYKRDWFNLTCVLKKSWCRKNKVPFDLDAEYLKSIWVDKCPVFNKPFVRHDKTDDFSPALDRIDPAKGYIKGNVRYISARANRIKYNASVEELKQVLAYVEGATTIP